MNLYMKYLNLFAKICEFQEEYLYGFPIGVVAKFDIENNGIISPGSIEYDINCDVRLLVADISAKDIGPYLDQLATKIFNNVPSDVGRGGDLIWMTKN